MRPLNSSIANQPNIVAESVLRTVSVVSLIGTLFLLSGCAGVSITPISKEQADSLHGGNSGRSGYVVYHPIVVFPVTESLTGTGGSECKVGPSFTLPDYSKPYLVEVTSGFGKAGVELEFSNQWGLGKVKDTSDNTAVLEKLTSALPIGLPFSATDAAGARNFLDALKEFQSKRATCATGLYRVESDYRVTRMFSIYEQ